MNLQGRNLCLDMQGNDVSPLTDTIRQGIRNY